MAPRPVVNPGARNGRVGAFDLAEELGGGGSARVFAARHRGTGSEVALKVYRSERSRRLADGVRFLREARVLTELDHPGVPRLLESGLGGRGCMFLALELRSGKSLASCVATAAAAPAEAARHASWQVLLPAVVRACEAVAHAHGRGVAHGDLTTANVLVDGERVSVIDWGLADAIGAARRLPRSLGPSTRPRLVVFGTPGAIAPERIASPGAPLSPLEDVYGLGGLLYEAACLQQAIRSESIEGRLAAAFRAPQAPSHRAPDLDIPAALDDLALRALDPDPAARPPSAAALGAELAALLAREAAQADRHRE